MKKQGRLLILMILCWGSTACMTSVWTGAQLIYERHHFYKKWNDFNLVATTNRTLYKDKAFKCKACSIDVAAFNGDLLIAGHVPTEELKIEAQHRIEKNQGYRRFFNELTVSSAPPNTIEDSWITTKIRSQIVADDDINPDAFKIVTADSIVYIMGDVKPAQAKKVIKIARYTSGVSKVVKMMKYFTYHDKITA